MSRCLVIAIGNPLRGDDGVGWHLAQHLAGPTLPPDVRLHVCQQLTPELAEPLARAECALFIDASMRGSPGTIYERLLRPATLGAAPFTHNLDVSTLLAIAATLYGRVPHSTLLAVSGQSFELSRELSAPVEATLPKLAERVLELVRGRESTYLTRREIEGKGGS